MGTTAAHAADLRAAVDELGPTARHAAEALRASCNAALPATRRFARDLPASLPELPATIAAAKPWLAQAEQLLGDDELGGLLDELQPATANLAELGHARSEPGCRSIDAFNRCVTNVLIPTGNLKVDDGALSANTENYKEFWYALVGQAGEGQGFDGNGGFLRLQAAGGATHDPHRQDQLLRLLLRRHADAAAAEHAAGLRQQAAAVRPLGARARQPGPRRQQRRLDRPGVTAASPNAPAPNDKAVDNGGGGS